MTRITKIMSIHHLVNTEKKSFVCEFPEERICAGNCKQPYTPIDTDRSTRRPSCYFKSCFGCREKSKVLTKSYLAKKFNTVVAQQAGQADR